MNTVLVVDDDESFLLSLIDGFKSYQNQFGIITAHNGEEAVAILDEQEIQLVLTDLKMPKMDGFALVAHLSAHFPELPVIVMTAFGTPDIEESLKEIGAFQYIEKPIDFNLLVAKILKGLKGRSQGFISGVSLSSFLQLLALDKKTCTLTIRSGKQKGTMHFIDGDLWDADTDQLSGTEAAIEIISWKNVEIELKNTCTKNEQKIQKSLGFILLEVSRMEDEKNSPTVDPAAQMKSNTTLNAIDLADLDSGLNDFLSEDNPSTIAEPEPTPSAIYSVNPFINQFITMLNRMPDINNSFLISTEGSLIYSTTNTIDDQTSNFITYIALAGKQLQAAMGAGEQQYSLLNLSSGNKLLILCGKEIIVGLEIGGAVMAGPIATGLRPALTKITL